MSIQLGSAYGIITISDMVSPNIKKASASLSAFTAALKTGSAPLSSFGQMLTNAGKEAGLNERQVIKMASATGIYTDQQILAARASADVSAKAQELAKAVANGTMTTREAGRAFADFAKANEVAASGSNSLLGSVKNMAKGISVGLAVITGGVIAVKKALDFGEEGAKFAQTKESFDSLMSAINTSPEILAKLRTASRRTVDDLTLMSSMEMLLAGTQGELATALAEASPQLMEMAKAAQKLNPSLGNTSFLFDSLTRGIKRGSPMILDNLGIVVKLEAAYQKYADSIGKSSDQLTAEEQKIALLNEVLRQGDVVLKQAGGTTESATDKFARLDAALQNLGNTVKEDIAPPLADAAEALQLFLTRDERATESLANQSKEVYRSADSYAEYVSTLDNAAKAEGYVTDTQGRLFKTYILGRKRVYELIDANYILSQGEYEAAKATEILGDTRREGIEQMRAYQKQTTNVAKAISDATLQFEQAQKVAKGKLVLSIDSNISSDVAGIIENIDYIAAGGDDVNAAFDAIQQGIDSGLLEPMTEAKTMLQNAYVESQKIQVSLGNITAWEAAKSIKETLGISLQDALTLVRQVKSEASFNAAAYLKLNVTYSVNPEATKSGYGEVNATLNPGRAKGGTVLAGQSYLVGEQGVEMFTPSLSGTIIPNSDLSIPSSGNTTVGGDTYMGGDTFNFHNYDRGSAKINKAIVAERKRNRLNASAGR